MTLNYPQRLDSPPASEQATVGIVGSRWDRVRWGAIWAGAIVALPTFIVLQLLFFALGWLDLGFDASTSGTTASIVSGILALVGFFIGGLVAGAGTLWRSGENGVLHGVLVWALAVTGALAFALLGGGALLGPLANVAAEIVNLQQLLALDPEISLTQALQDARRPAGWGALVLGLSAGAAALGGLAGSKIWPPRPNEVTRRY